MTKLMPIALALGLVASAPAWAQGQGHKGMTNTMPKSSSSLATGATAGATNPNQAMGSATGGTGGSAAAGTTSATTLGLGAVSNAPSGSSSALGTGGSAATAEGGRVDSRSKITGNDTNAQSKAMANEGAGEWSKSKTKTKIHGDQIDSRTKSMSHLPGGPPSKSTTRLQSAVPTTP